jgi:anti-anti-sigma factor
MLEVSTGWRLDVDVSSEWLFFRLTKECDDAEPTPPLANHVWSVAEQQAIHRFVVELDAQTLLSSYLVGQLILLCKRAHQRGGVMRLCGLTDAQYQVIQIMRLGPLLPNYQTRGDAVTGHRPTEPR